MGEGGSWMAKPFKGVINVDIRDSVPDWEPYTQPIAPEGSPNVLYGSQPYDQRDGVDHGGLRGLPELQRPHPVRVCHDRRGPRRARLEHLHDRQVAPDGR